MLLTCAKISFGGYTAWCGCGRRVKMSLFRLLNYWSLTLNQLEELVPRREDEDEEILSMGDEKLANFTVCPGTFKSIGDRVVLVCGSLSGLLCIIQVPEDQQAPSKSATRQVLAAKKLLRPIVDLKCAFFSSTVKQSIAVLSFDELSIYQVKKSRPPDLLSGGNTNDQPYNLLADHLFSHSFEEVYKFSLQPNEIASGIRVSLQDSSNGSQQNTSEARDSSHGSSLTLPQRDYIVVQYTNQFLFTLINHKKIVAHYEIKYPPNSNSSDSKQVQQLSCYLDAQAMSWVHNLESDYLAIAMTNNYLYYFSVSKLISLSKDNVMKRVVNSLLSTTTGVEPLIEQQSSLAYNNDRQTITIDLELNEHSEWQLELASTALQVQSISLDNGSTSQIVVMSRYCVDVYSCSAKHLWSYRSETPLICMHAYALECSKVATLICSDFQNDERCNLLVLEDGTKVWSSLMYQKPSHIWRISLAQIDEAIATLAVRDSCLSFGYLGTNMADAVEYCDGDDAENTSFTQLECLTDSLFDGNQSRGKGYKSYPSLLLDISLQASNKWPQVCVHTKINIKPDSKSHGVLQNIVVYLEFDDLLNFTPDNRETTKSSLINEGALQVELGTFWTDGAEPLSLSGSFSLKPAISIKSGHAYPRSNVVKLSIKFFLPQNEMLVQQASFLLPLTLMANLIHVDYSCADQLSDGSTKYDMSQTYQANPKYTCVIASKIEGKLIEFTDQLIESDLVCRGYNSESRENQLRLMKVRSENYATTLENLALLSQSPDCRLRYKSLGSGTPIPAQDTEDCSPLVAVRMAFEFRRIFMFPDVMLDSESAGQHSEYLTVCLHLYELVAKDFHLSKEVLRAHFKSIPEGDRILDKLVQEKAEGTVVIAIESEHPLALVLVQQHLMDRLKLGCTEKSPSASKTKLEVASNTAQVWPSLSLCEFLRNLHLELESRVRKQFEEMKKKLDFGFYKFHLTSMAILSYSKRLPDLPGHSCDRLESLVSLNRKYELHLVEVLSGLEQLSQLDRQYSKIPDFEGFTYRSGCGVEACTE